MTAYRDHSGRTLDEYPRPSVAVDTAVLTVPQGGALSVLIVRTEFGWRLPGTFLHEHETLADAVLRSLSVKAGVTGLSPRQLRVFDDPTRDERGWVLSVAHLDAVPIAQLVMDDALARLSTIAELPELPYGHGEMLESAVETLRAEYATLPDPRALIRSPFTLRSLQAVHEAVDGATLQRDRFRRRMDGQLVATGDTIQGRVGKPARLFTRRD